jgi:NAD(P)-dependent dehydrogenase (short-subunit alcohol dehydrogenase family)
MRIMVVGATGTIGRPTVAALSGKHEVVSASHARAAEHVDLADPRSIQSLYKRVGPVDAVISAAGQAAFGELAKLSDADFELCLRNKLMGQVNLVRFGIAAVRDGGSFTLTSGILARQPMPGSAGISLVNAGLEGFVRAAALELPRGIRINIVSPGWVSETLQAMGRDPKAGTPAAQVARAYVGSVEGKQSGTVIEP